jgi:hypothetical protein
MLLLLALACGHEHEHEHGDDTAGSDTGWSEDVALTSDGGSFYLMYSADPDPIPFNEPFSTYWMVHDGTDRSLMYNDATLTLDVTMPAHGHGMNTVPAVTMDEMGTFTAEGFLFHMRGWWAIEATATRDGVTESATFYVNCCED